MSNYLISPQKHHFLIKNTHFHLKNTPKHPFYYQKRPFSPPKASEIDGSYAPDVISFEKALKSIEKARENDENTAKMSKFGGKNMQKKSFFQLKIFFIYIKFFLQKKKKKKKKKKKNSHQKTQFSKKKTQKTERGAKILSLFSRRIFSNAPFQNSRIGTFWRPIFRFPSCFFPK
jgi:hypothetical protein